MQYYNVKPTSIFKQEYPSRIQFVWLRLFHSSRPKHSLIKFIPNTDYDGFFFTSMNKTTLV